MIFNLGDGLHTIADVSHAAEDAAPQNQSEMEDVAYSFTIPADIFTDVDSEDSLTYSAILGNGTLLPAWLTFDPVPLTVQRHTAER